MGVTWISCGGGDDVFCCVMDVESGCGLPWRMWMECVAMCVDGCVERVCPRELCGVRFEVRGVHASGLSSMCPSVYAMLWCYGRGFFRCMEARELVGCMDVWVSVCRCMD